MEHQVEWNFFGEITKEGKGHAKILNFLLPCNIKESFVNMSSTSDEDDKKMPAVLGSGYILIYSKYSNYQIKNW